MIDGSTLVTGATGFAGSHLLDTLADHAPGTGDIIIFLNRLSDLLFALARRRLAALPAVPSPGSPRPR